MFCQNKRGTTYTYTYNGLGDRVSQTVGGVTPRYTLDLNTGLTQVLADGTNTYLYGLERIAQYSGTNPAYFLGDALGSVRQLVDSTGAVTLTKSYKPFGDVLSSTGTGTTVYGFDAEMTDPTGLVYLRARYYSSGQGRFISRDTWGGDPKAPISYNAWVFLYEDPINSLDPSGQKSCENSMRGCGIPPTEPEPPDYTGPDDYYSYSVNPPYKATHRPAGIHFDGTDLSPVFYIETNSKGGNSSLRHRKVFADQFIGNTDPLALMGTDPITNQPIYWPSVYGTTTHSGLCGLFSVTAILQHFNDTIGINDVVNNFIKYIRSGPPDQQPWDTLDRLINETYPTIIKDTPLLGYKDFNNAGVKNMIQSKLNAGSFFLGLVVAHNGQGILTGTNSSQASDTDHWVVITGISQEWDYAYTPNYDRNNKVLGSPWRWFRIYNPLKNRTEYYPSQVFQNAWRSKDNANDHVLLQVDPVHEKKNLPRCQ